MSPLLRKEVRVLLPAWIAAVVVATMPLWQVEFFAGGSLVFFALAILVLALCPFGQEISCGTFGLLLVQPQERARTWWVKITLLVIAFLSVEMLFVLCLSHSPLRGDRDGAVFGFSALVALLAFSGGLWSTLLLRDFTSAILCTILAPMGIWGATVAVVGHWINPENQSAQFDPILYSILVAYGVIGLLFARRLFLGAQDLPWTGGQIFLKPGRGFSLRSLGLRFEGGTHPWLALAQKELQLQEVPLFLIPLLLLAHLVALAGRRNVPPGIEHTILGVVVPFIWLWSVPCVIGCVAVAEERRLNTLEGLLCAPVSKRVSFAIKFTVAMVLGTVVGGILPWLLAHWAVSKDLKFGVAIVTAPAITGVAFYASSMSRGLLQAIPTALLIPTPVTAVIALAHTNHGPVFDYSPPHWLERLVDCSALTIPVLVVTGIWLAFRNYQRLQTGGRMYLENLSRAGAVAGCLVVASTAIFDRCWELLERVEPPHGPPRLTGDVRPGMAVTAAGVTVLLPDGRLWCGKWIEAPRMYRIGNHEPFDLFQPGVTHRLSECLTGGFVTGPNHWIKLANGFSKVVAMRSDHTLWRIAGPSELSQIGTDSDWNEVSGFGTAFLAVKEDGTLWGWGYDYGLLLQTNVLPRPRNVLRQTNGLVRQTNADYDITQFANRVPYPSRVGNESDWVNAFPLQDRCAIGIKRDGTVWMWGEEMRFYQRGNTWTGHPFYVKTSLAGTNWNAMVGSSYSTLGVRADGTLWATSSMGGRPGQVLFLFNMFGGETIPMSGGRIGHASDWVALSTSRGYASGIEADGALHSMGYEHTVKPSKYTDWLATAQYGEYTWGLARDGTISCWKQLDMQRVSLPTGNINLGPSRRPLVSGNILSEQK